MFHSENQEKCFWGVLLWNKVLICLQCNAVTEQMEHQNMMSLKNARLQSHFHKVATMQLHCHVTYKPNNTFLEANWRLAAWPVESPVWLLYGSPIEGDPGHFRPGSWYFLLLLHNFHAHIHLTSDTKGICPCVSCTRPIDFIGRHQSQLRPTSSLPRGPGGTQAVTGLPFCHQCQRTHSDQRVQTGEGKNTQERLQEDTKRPSCGQEIDPCRVLNVGLIFLRDWSKLWFKGTVYILVWDDLMDWLFKSNTLNNLLIENNQFIGPIMNYLTSRTAAFTINLLIIFTIYC